MAKQIYECVQCGADFQKYPSQVKGVANLTCSRECRYKRQSIYSKGSNNSNYRHGVHCEPSKCECGGSKDYRASQCNRCSVNITKYFAAGTPRRNTILWRYIRTYSLIPYESCVLCGLGREWNQKELVLQLDHIDGNPTNNLIDNLRVLCPNCHTQTDTYASKNKGKR